MKRPDDISDLVKAIQQLTAQIYRLTSGSPQNVSSPIESLEQELTAQATDLPESLASIPGVEIIEVNAPQFYAKFRCQVCLREWIVPIPLEKLESYQPPRYCRWCNSIVWSKPERAQIRSDQRSKRARAIVRSRDLGEGNGGTTGS